MQISISDIDGDESIACYQSEIAPKIGEIIFMHDCTEYRVEEVRHVLVHHGDRDHITMVECRVIPV